MAHLHEMRDSDKHFVINQETMVITNNSKKRTLQQGDHKSEIYTFELPRLIDGHNMELCNLVEIHYINIKGDKTEKSEDVHTVKDMAVSEDDPDTIVFTWTVHGNATKYAGSLNFRIRFACTDENGAFTYRKHTEIFKGITISEGFDNAAAVEEDNSDILSQWEARLDALESGKIADSVYFDIDYDGVVSLKPEYRGNPQNNNYPNSVSDNGVGVDGSKINELPEVLIIPDVINNIAVSALCEGMFRSNLRVKSITIPIGVTTIPKGFVDLAANLAEVKGTENIEVINQAAFQKCGIEKAIFPNLKAFEGGGGHFNGAANLVIVDIGNTIKALPPSCFYGCERLSLICGGASVTQIGQKAFFATRSLKNLPFVSNATSIQNEAFVLSRVTNIGTKYNDWWDFEEKLPSAFKTDATPAIFNKNKWWEGCTYTVCEQQLGTTFHQKDPRFKDDVLPNSVDKWEDGCVEISAVHIYSALMGVEFDSPNDFIDLLRDKTDEFGSLIVPLDNDGDYSWNDMARWLTALGLECEVLSCSNTNLQKVYDDLADGAMVISSINPGHAGVLYGIAPNGEVLVLDSAPYIYNLGVYEAATFQQPIWSLMKSDAVWVVVKKN